MSPSHMFILYLLKGDYKALEDLGNNLCDAHPEDIKPKLVQLQIPNPNPSLWLDRVSTGIMGNKMATTIIY